MSLPDPMGLEDLRVSLYGEAGKRWTRAANAVNRAIVAGDALGIGDKAPVSTIPVSDKVEQFQRWLDERLLIEVGDGWMGPQIEAAGGRAQASVHGVWDAEASSFEPRSKTVCCAAASAALAGIRDAVSLRASAAVKAGLFSSHRRASRIAAHITQEMGRGLRSTRLLAEHALSMAYNQASLDAFEDAGVTHVGTRTERRLWDFDPGEPRDERGRWTSSGSSGASGEAGAGYEFASPNVGQGDWPSATGPLSERERRFAAASNDVDHELGLSASTVPVIGAWADGAERSLMTSAPGVDWDRLKLAGAMKGHLGDQKAVLVFKDDHPEPNAAMYSFPATGDLAAIHHNLLADGLAFHTLQPTAGGAMVHVVDTDLNQHEAVERAAGRYGATVQARSGRAEFIGTAKQDGTDREQRDDARRAYGETIAESPVPGAAAIWAGVHHRWAAALAHDQALDAWFEDAARKNPQAKHPRTGQFAKAHVVAREKARHKRTGQFQVQRGGKTEQLRAERAEAAFRRAPDRLDVLTQGDDRVCDACDSIAASGPYSIGRARSLIPAHPNCRCVFIAAGSNRLRGEDGLSDYDPDQPRDEQGQWTSGGGIVAYHGAAADFAKFDLAHMESGEGALNYGGGWGTNEYGHGLYFAEEPQVGQTYRESIASHGATAGTLYQVRLHARADEFLDWDKPLSAQPQAVKDLVGGRAPLETSGGHLMMGWIGTGPKGAARLVAHGIKGVRYLDQQSRAAGRGTSNYVVMDPSIIEITHKNGVRLGDAEMRDALIDLLSDYDPNEPRNEQGEWTTGGGGFSGAQVHALTKLPLMAGEAPHKKGSREVVEVARDLTARSQDQLKAMGVQGGKITLENTTPERNEMLAQALAHETEAELHTTGNAADWYKGKIESAMRLAALEHPEVLTDKNARSTLSVALAVTSQGETVNRNAELGEAAYAQRDAQGKFAELQPASAQGADMLENLKKYNSLIDKLGQSGATEFLSRQMTVRQLNDFGYKFGSLPKDTMVSGSAMFGPKLGNGFYQNLTGNYTPVTQDLWFMRTWGRLTGTLMDTTRTEEGRAASVERFTNALKASKQDVPKTAEGVNNLARKIFKQHESDYGKHTAEYKSGARVKGELQLSAQALVHGIDGIREHPGGGKERLWREGVVNRAREILAGRGVKLTNADLQATIWYPEKTLYERLGSKGPIGGLADYATGFEKLMRSKGHTDAEIASALRAPSRRSGSA